MSRRIALLVNPTSGKGRGAREGTAAATRLRELGLTVDVLIGVDGTAAGGLARNAVQQGYDAVNLDGGLVAWAQAGLPLE